MNLFETYDGSADYVVVHCEFSALRGPALIDLITEYDKFKNPTKLLFPKLYLLVDGYSNFYPNFSKLCDGGYHPEFSTPFNQELNQMQRREDMITKVRNLINAN
jgi:hypothetical protein